MDIHENEEQHEELEPLSGVPQPVPELDQDSSEAESAQAITPEILEPHTEEIEEEDDQEDPEDMSSDPREIHEEAPMIESVEEPILDDVSDEDLDETDESDQTAVEISETDESDETMVELSETDESDQTAVELSETDEEVSQEEIDTPDVEEVELDAVPADPYALASAIEEPVAEDGRAWYVIHCYSGNEDKVRHNILQRIESMGMDDLIFDVVVPTEDEVNIKNGERQITEKKVFPGYILVYMVLTEESWYMVRNTPGVTGFVGMGNDPTALQPEEVARILKRMESESPRINVTFRTGERVRIVDGPFLDFYGKVSDIDMDRATVRVMVNFFGRETPVELDFLQVEEA